MGAAVELHNIKKSFGSVSVIDGVDLTVAQGEFVVFVGPSGSGKSTLLRVIAGLESTTSGDIIINEQNVTYAEPSDRGIAMVFQSYALYPHMSVADNLSFSLKMNKSPLDRIAEAVKGEALLERSPAQLSGGQRQRVALARAIVFGPRILLMDEPLSNLDAALRVGMRMEILELHNKLETTMIYVTHDQVEAMTLADRIVALDDGHIQQIGTPLELYKNPSNLFVASFIGSPKMNLVTGKIGPGALANSVELDGTAQLTITAKLGGQSGGDVITVGFRPEGVRIVKATEKGAIHAEIETIERLGNVTYVYVDAGLSQLLTIQASAGFEPEIGDKLSISFDPDQSHFFDKDGYIINN